MVRSNRAGTLQNAPREYLPPPLRLCESKGRLTPDAPFDRRFRFRWMTCRYVCRMPRVGDGGWAGRGLHGAYRALFSTPGTCLNRRWVRGEIWSKMGTRLKKRWVCGEIRYTNVLNYTALLRENRLIGTKHGVWNQI